MEKRSFKTKKILAAVVFVVILFMQGNWANAQFIWSPNNFLTPISSRFGDIRHSVNPDNQTLSIGIGQFTYYGALTHSFLDVNSNYLGLPQNGSITSLGEVFRTDCPATDTPFWRMYRGGIPKANFYNPVISPTGGFDDLVVETPDKGSNILFKTGAHNRVIIQDGPGTGTTAGYVGIGPDFYLPQSLLHINNGNFQTYMQITNATTSATATDGFRVGIASDGTAELRQQEDLDIIFYTNNTEQMKITSDNKIKVNSLSSNKKNFVIADEDGTLMLYAINTKKAKISELETRITELEKKIYNLEQVIALK